MFLRTTMQSARFLVCVVPLVTACCGDGDGASPTGPTATAGVQVPQSVRGSVQDPAGRYLVGARVEALDGPSAGTAAFVRADGVFDFIGTFDQYTRFAASFEGHETLIDTTHCSVVNCAGARPWMFFQLRPLAAPIDLSGDYTLTIAAAEGCALPGDALSRNYQVAISKRFRTDTADLMGFDLAFRSPAVLESMRHLYIGVAVDYISLFVYSGEADPGLAEDLGLNRYVSFVGSSSATVNRASTSKLDLTFDGTIEAVTTQRPLGAAYTPLPSDLVSKQQCKSEYHRLLLTRIG